MGQLAAKIRQKYPGQYDDLDDSTLESKVVSKYPQYKDMIETPKEPANEVSSEQLVSEAKSSLSKADKITSQEKTKSEPEKPKSVFKKAWDFATTPLTDVPSQFARRAAESIDQPSVSRSPTRARLEGFGAGAIEGVGNLISGETAPLSIALSALGLSKPIRSGLGKVSKALSKTDDIPEVFPESPTIPINPKTTSVPSVVDTLPPVPKPTKPTEDLVYDIAREKFNMGKELPETKPKSKVESDWEYEQKSLEVETRNKETLAAIEKTPSKTGEMNVKDIIRLGEPGRVGSIANHERSLVDELKSSIQQEGVLEPIIIRKVNNNRGYVIEDGHHRLQASRELGMENIPVRLGEIGSRSPEVKRLGEVTSPSAEFLGLQQDGSPLYNIKGGPRDKSTVTKATLDELGITAPEVPIDAKPVRGEDLRKIAMAERQAKMDSKNKGFKGTEEPISVANDTGAPLQPEVEIQTELDKINNAGKSVKWDDQKKSLWGEFRDANRSLLTAFDFSAAGRQGKPLIMTKAYWNSFDDMFKSWGSQRAYDNVMESITRHPNFQRPIGKNVSSLAERAGLRVGGREETFKSDIIEKYIPGVKRSERAYSAFLNKLRADHFNTMVTDANRMGLDPSGDDVILKGIGSFINDATGRGSLGKLESAAPLLNEMFFAPRLMASRVNMYKRWLNPRTYGNENPVVRQQAIKSLLSVSGFGLTVGTLARLGGASVSSDPRSSDFGKARIGNTRIDPFSGFQQYAVGASRLLSGELTSSNTGKTLDLTSGKFGMPTRASVTSQFMQNKLAPIPSFIWSWMEGRDWSGEPFEVKQSLLDRTIPIVMQDLHDIWQEDPKLFPAGVFKDNPELTKVGMSALPVFGEGVQTYGR